MNELNLLNLAFSVSDVLASGLYDKVSLLGSFDYPLEVVKRDFIVMRNKERLH